MSEPTSNSRTAAFVPGSDDPGPHTGTLAAPPGPPPALVPPARAAQSSRAVSLVTDSHDPDAELTALLRRRLRQMVLMFSVALAAFLVRDTLTPSRAGLHLQWFILVIATPLQFALVTLSWTRWARTTPRLRVIELAALGLCWIVIGGVQFDWLRNWNDIGFYLGGERSTDGQILIANTWALPWFALIAGYPVVVPNPVRRTLVLAVFMATLPFVVTVAAVLTGDRIRWSETGMMFVQFAIWCPLAVGLAVYGAHQAGLLRAQAFSAKRFGQYRLTRKLGGGGMGEVYLAEHLLLRRPSVVKVIRADRTGDRALLRRFEREVQILATLTHWNTVEVFDYGHTSDGTFYYVMEYLPGFDLDALVNRHGALQPGRAVHLLRQVCAALREAHACGLIHRDVKPGNVMACRRGGVPDVAKLLDFGLVHAAPADSDAAKLTGEGTVLGTPAYMSPEQAAGRPCDGRSDIYSLGATAFFLLTGRAPFVGNTMEVIAAHLMAPVPCPTRDNPAVPEDLAAVVRKCLAKKSDDRFADVADLEAAFARCACAAEWDERRAGEWWETCGAGVKDELKDIAASAV